MLFQIRFKGKDVNLLISQIVLIFILLEQIIYGLNSFNYNIIKTKINKTKEKFFSKITFIRCFVCISLSILTLVLGGFLYYSNYKTKQYSITDVADKYYFDLVPIELKSDYNIEI